ncbi:unnamed protein product [Ostreobium quekettii]|uniref:Uncharacterized protein n=1 Tax=Ostreobium quekettii TaxID=121088 RepID=A0A8S1IXY5_9CHLO|nr:unnamed protein product [Ostreobium quekettii]
MSARAGKDGRSARRGKTGVTPEEGDVRPSVNLGGVVPPDRALQPVASDLEFAAGGGRLWVAGDDVGSRDWAHQPAAGDLEFAADGRAGDGLSGMMWQVGDFFLVV